MKKLQKKFNRKELTVESMVDVMSGCNCYCGTVCPCTTISDYAGYQSVQMNNYATSYNKTPASIG